jgi:hypothetical protein
MITARNRALVHDLLVRPARISRERVRRRSRIVTRTEPDGLDVLALYECARQGLLSVEAVTIGTTTVTTYRVTALGRAATAAPVAPRNRRKLEACVECGEPLNDPNDPWSLDLGGKICHACVLQADGQHRRPATSRVK